VSLLFPPLILVLVAAVVSTAVLCLLLKPLLRRYALARPNARSSHQQPTPQGAGIAILLTALLLVPVLLRFEPGHVPYSFLPLALATLIVALVSGIDDIRPLSPFLRLGVQMLAATTVVLALPPIPLDASLVPWVRLIAVLGLVWWMNAVNFIDGIDLITVAHLLPLCFACGVLAVFFNQTALAVLGLVLAGSLIGFAFFNRPPALLFLGDVGSVPLALLTGFVLLSLAPKIGAVPILLMTAYPMLDATFTLVRRALKGEKVWHAHKTHLYQKAVQRGYSVKSVSGVVFATAVLTNTMAVLWVLWGVVGQP
jgi:UDP-N-acetylmuramyl pentapeptide phosphotransferase/UDP-N-acetylglucosamine-1-phosphate transferase